MGYQIHEVKPEDREEWNNFVARNGGSFLQSYEWSEFQQSLGRSCWRFQISDFRFQNTAAQALVVQHGLPLGKSYLYCPRGPVIDFRFQISDLRLKGQNAEILQTFVDYIKEIAKREKTVFLRIDPEWRSDEPESIIQILSSLGFRKSPKEVQPKQTVIADLTKSEEELLKEMHPKTRYNIRLAQRRGVQFSVFPPSGDLPQGDNFSRFARSGAARQFPNKLQNSNSQNHFEDFWRLLRETAKRDGFRTHPEEYYRRQLLEFAPSPCLLFGSIEPKSRQGEIGSEQKLFVAEHDGRVVAGAIVNFWNKRATYLHGASDYNLRSLMAPYLLHWEIMKEAKRRGFQEYDFWGIDEKKWPGLTRFKTGFGGRHIEYAGAYDFVLEKFWHTVYRIGFWAKGAT